MVGRRQRALAPGPMSLRPLAQRRARSRCGEGDPHAAVSTPHLAGHTPGTLSPRTESLLRKENQSVRSASPWSSKDGGKTMIQEAEKAERPRLLLVSGPPPGSPSLRTASGRLTCRGPRGHHVAS